MKNEKQKAFIKACRVIRSVNTAEQLNNAFNYMCNYTEQFGISFYIVRQYTNKKAAIAAASCQYECTYLKTAVS